MPIPTERPSVGTTLEERYSSQKVGGAYDAKSAGGSKPTTVDAFSNQFADGFTIGGKNTNFPKKNSSLLEGHSTEKYKP